MIHSRSVWCRRAHIVATPVAGKTSRRPAVGRCRSNRRQTADFCPQTGILPASKSLKACPGASCANHRYRHRCQSPGNPAGDPPTHPDRAQPELPQRLRGRGGRADRAHRRGDQLGKAGSAQRGAGHPAQWQGQHRAAVRGRLRAQLEGTYRGGSRRQLQHP